MNSPSTLKIHRPETSLIEKIKDEIKKRAEAKAMLLCLKIDLNGDWTEIVYGDFALVKNAARYSARGNKHMVAISALVKIAKSVRFAGSVAHSRIERGYL